MKKMNLSSLSKREKIILISVSIFICAVFLWRIALDPIFKALAKVDSLITARQLKLQRNVKLLSKYEPLKKEYKKYAPLIKVSQSDEQQAADMLSQIEQLARKTDSYISAIKPYSSTDFGFYKKFLVEVELELSIKDLMKFLYEIKMSDNYLKVESMEIDARPQAKSLVRSNLLISSVSFKN